MKKVLSIILTLALMVSLVACGSSTEDKSNSTSSTSTGDSTTESSAAASSFGVGMVTDVGGINDQSFNQSAWEGLQQFSKETNATISYLESKQESDYGTNLDKMADQNNSLIWGIGYAMADAIKTAAAQYPDKTYAIVDNSYGDETPSNVIGVVFKAQEPSFLVGYVAAKTTKTNKVGFVGGIKGDVIDQFEFGYRAGVAYASKELGKEITVNVQYANSFSDQAAGKAIASSMYTKGCDIVFHAAGGAGIGVIEAAKEANKFAIGVDRDQSHLAPNNILISAMKLVGKAMNLVSTQVKDGKELGGTTQVFGMKEGCVGIPENNPNVDQKVLSEAKAVEAKIIDESINVPYNQATFDDYIKTLK
ncbi:BMP family lipoprotein [Ruminiclostridium josui]|uniref:BMP family lipoprotein n=1 Tax=Ruminiclostridium josui TaxID=1499 RepID=UPI0004663CA8|nr:BMP family ABC transporter substrate-binding protein [Ruminiclostridium josui]